MDSLNRALDGLNVVIRGDTKQLHKLYKMIRTKYPYMPAVDAFGEASAVIARPLIQMRLFGKSLFGAKQTKLTWPGIELVCTVSVGPSIEQHPAFSGTDPDCLVRPIRRGPGMPPPVPVGQRARLDDEWYFNVQEARAKGLMLYDGLPRTVKEDWIARVIDAEAETAREWLSEEYRYVRVQANIHSAMGMSYYKEVADVATADLQHIDVLMLDLLPAVCDKADRDMAGMLYPG